MADVPSPIIPLQRAIDKLASHPKRPVEMQVLVLGLSRTSTFSMCEALEKLGYKAYHITKVFFNFKAGHMAYWHDALMRKYYHGPGQYGKAEFDKILGQYGAVTAAPCMVFSDELLRAYPDAKVVLLHRDPDKWLASMESSYYRILGWRVWQMIASIDGAMLGPYNRLLKLVLSFWTRGDPLNRTALRQGLLDHNSHIRNVVPKAKLLEFHSTEGWEPLCKFLGKPVPQGPYPRVNEGAYTADRHWWAIWIRLVVVVGKAIMYLSGPIILFLAVLWA